MKIYTRTGDQGETSVWGRATDKRVPKDSLRVRTYGTVDEANAVLGVAVSFVNDESLLNELRWVQNRLFALGADLSNINPERRLRISGEDVITLEQAIDRVEVGLEPLKSFILPGGSRGSAFLHHGRTVIRRAERLLVSLGNEDVGLTEQLKFLNRLSDYLFVAARQANRAEGISDIEAEF